MNNKKIPTSRLSRTVITGMTGAHIGLKHVAHITKKPFTSKKQIAERKVLHEQDIGKILMNTLMQLRGTALKIAQMMSMELDTLPDGIRVELAKACSEVVPLNRAHIRKVFINEFNGTPENIFIDFDSLAFAAASLGQVHKAKSINNEILAVKIQYPGIATSIQSDMKLVRGIMKSLSMSTSYLPRYDIIDKILDRVEKQLNFETNYELEAENTLWFAENLKLPKVHIPKVFPQYSRSKVIVTEYINGKHLDQWLKNNPGKSQRDVTGQTLFDLFCYQLHNLNVLHADPHPGNFLFCDNNVIALIDYGCIHKLHPDFSKKVTQLFTREPYQLYQAYIEVGIISKSLTFEQYKNAFFPVIQEMYFWMTEPFQEKFYDFSTMPAMPKKSVSKIKNVMKHINDVQQDQMYFDRTFFGLISLLRKIGATINTEKFFAYDKF